MLLYAGRDYWGRKTIPGKHIDGSAVQRAFCLTRILVGEDVWHQDERKVSADMNEKGSILAAHHITTPLF